MNELRTVSLQIILFVSFLAALSGSRVIIAFVFLIALIALVRPVWARVIEHIWVTVLEKIGVVNRAVLLTIFYWCFIVPYGCLYRMFKKEDSAVFFERRTSSYYKDSVAQVTPEHFEKMW